MSDQHESHCLAWDWMNGDRTLNNAKACTCGLRARVAAEQGDVRTRYRAVKPLGMSEDDWLRTLGIKP